MLELQVIFKPLTPTHYVLNRGARGRGRIHLVIWQASSVQWETINASTVPAFFLRPYSLSSEEISSEENTPLSHETFFVSCVVVCSDFADPRLLSTTFRCSFLSFSISRLLCRRLQAGVDKLTPARIRIKNYGFQEKFTLKTNKLLQSSRKTTAELKYNLKLTK